MQFAVCNIFTPVVFHNVSNYDYHFIIKELASKFEGQFECLGENTERYKTFSVPKFDNIDAVANIDKDGSEKIYGKFIIKSC